jgi:hypothetical protein
VKIPWERFGAKLGVGFALAGFILIFLGWNGAASTDRVPSQFPYLISGGLAGLCLCVIGAALIIAETGREDRDSLRREIEELRKAIGQMGSGGNGSSNGSTTTSRAPRGTFVAGETTYHVPSCRLLTGRGDLPTVTREEITNRGLVACRVCDPSKRGTQTTRRR